jgi:hypothetical protein
MDEELERKSGLNPLPMGGVLAPYASDYNSQLIQGRYAAETRHALSVLHGALRPLAHGGADTA